jgi:ribosomal RNA assembly protein
MTEQVIATPRIKKFKQQIEKALNVKISFSGDNARIEGEGFEEYIALSVVEALNYGFELPIALHLKNEDYMMEKINLRKIVRPSRIQTIKARIIGLDGKTKRIISELTDCEVAIKDKIVAMIGKTEDVGIAKRAVTSLIQGSPHSSVYAFLEKNRRIMKEKIDFDEDKLK